MSKGTASFGASGRRWKVAALFFLLIIGTEIFLRTQYGFCDTVLIREDPYYEYIAQARQDRIRFKNHVIYNALSMRSEEVDSTAILILGCGDSVINGGVLTEQDSLATTILSAGISALTGRNVQFLNISAGSWGPDNCLAYLEHTPLPQAVSLVLFVSSHDAYDNMSFKKVVGVNKSFPDEQYASAILELIDRYLLPRIWKATDTDSQLGIDKGGDGFNTGFAGLKTFADQKGIPMTIYLHAEAPEIRDGAYGTQGQEIIRFAQDNNIPLIKDLDHGASLGLLRDKIHPDGRGQLKIAEIMLDAMKKDPAGFGLASFIP